MSNSINSTSNFPRFLGSATAAIVTRCGTGPNQPVGPSPSPTPAAVSPSTKSYVSSLRPGPRQGYIREDNPLYNPM